MRLVEFDQSFLLPQEKFYANGFELFSLSESKSDMVQILSDLFCGKIKTGFSWEQKSQSSFHLRPNVYEYDEVFTKFLFDTIPSYDALCQLTGKRLHLYHAQVVKTVPGPSYQDWHRDSYQWGNSSIVGAFPSVVKLNFYPEFEGEEPRLKYIRGSHRCQVNDPKFDAMLIGRYENEVLRSSNDRVIIFDTAMMHAVVPDVNPRGSIRLMYSFGMEHEYKKRFEHKSDHKKFHDIYEERLTK